MQSLESWLKIERKIAFISKNRVIIRSIFMLVFMLVFMAFLGVIFN